MSEQIGMVVDPDAPQAQPPPPETPSPQAAAPAEPPPEPPAEEDIPEAVEVQPGVKVVPVGVVKALRDELKALKPQAQKAVELEQAVTEFRPYVEFFRAHPHLLQGPQQPQAAPPPSPQEDPALVGLAKKLDLYTSDAKPDTARAAEIRDIFRADAQAAAQQAMQPVQESTWESRAAANIQWMAGQKDAYGRPLDVAVITDTVRSIWGALPPPEAKRVLADPKVAELIADVAVARQSRSRPVAQPQPMAPALHVEPAGGSVSLPVSEDHTRRLGVKHDDYVTAAKRFNPAAKSNPLE